MTLQSLSNLFAIGTQRSAPIEVPSEHAAAGALAAPRVIEETAKIPSPDPTFYWPLSVAIDGDWLLATGFKDLYETHPGGYVDDSAWLYQRQSNGSWTLVRRLVQAITQSDGDEPLMKVDIQGAYRKGTNGAWTLVRQTEPQPDEFCENEDDRGEVDVPGNAVMVFTWGNENGPYSARIFEGPFGTTAVMTRLVAPAGEPYVFIDPVAIDLPSALVSASAPIGVQAFTRNTSGVWERSGALLRPDNLAVSSPSKIKARGGLAVVGFPVDGAHGLRTGSASIFQRNTNGTTLDTAPLPITLNRNYRVRLEAIGTRLRLFVDDQVLAEASDSTHTHGSAGVMMYKTRADYDNIVVSGNPHTTLATYQFRAEHESQTNWQTLGTWTEANGVYAQSDLAAGARSIGGIATDDQIVNARMRRTSGAGTNNWFGLATRYRDAGNYYYITLRNDNTIALRKLVNNAIVELDTAPFTVTTNTWYRTRFEAVGTQLRVYINDQLQLEAADASHATGRYGPLMYRTAAQYDDILAVQP